MPRTPRDCVLKSILHFLAVTFELLSLICRVRGPRHASHGAPPLCLAHLIPSRDSLAALQRLRLDRLALHQCMHSLEASRDHRSSVSSYFSTAELAANADVDVSSFLGTTSGEAPAGHFVYEDRGSLTAYSPTSLSPSLRRLSMASPSLSGRGGSDTERELSSVMNDAIAQARARGANSLTCVRVGRNEAGAIWVAARATIAMPIQKPSMSVGRSPMLSSSWPHAGWSPTTSSGSSPSSGSFASQSFKANSPLSSAYEF